MHENAKLIKKKVNADSLGIGYSNLQVASAAIATATIVASVAVLFLFKVETVSLPTPAPTPVTLSLFQSISTPDQPLLNASNSCPTSSPASTPSIVDRIESIVRSQLENFLFEKRLFWELSKGS